MSYRKTIYAHASGTGPDMTDDEFETTVAEWETSFPALAAKIRGLQNQVTEFQRVLMNDLEMQPEDIVVVPTLHTGTGATGIPEIATDIIDPADAIAPSVKTDDDPNADQEPDGDPPRAAITPSTSDEQTPAAGAGL